MGRYGLGLLLLGAILASVFGTAGCQNLETAPAQSVFRVDGDTTWTRYSRLVVVVATPQGTVIDTLFDDSLPTLERLWHLQAPHYAGGPALIAIYGYRGGQLAYSQGREYDGATQRVLVLQDSIPVLGLPTVGKSDSTPPAQTPVKPPKDSATPPVSPPAQAQGGPPVLLAVQPDTTLSIRDAVPMYAQVQSGGSRITFVGWDYEDDGRFDDSTASTPPGWRFVSNPRYNGVGSYVCRIVVRSATGKTEARVRVTVLYDAPVADAGEDTTVAPGTWIFLHARGSDGFGPIVKREWQIGTTPFKTTVQESKMLAPALEGELRCILRVTDNDGLTALDTLTVTIEPPEDSAILDGL